jgi:hypothetical protein
VNEFSLAFSLIWILINWFAVCFNGNVIGRWRYGKDEDVHHYIFGISLFLIKVYLKIKLFDVACCISIF